MDMPIPAGYEENEFGFLFAAPVGGAVCDICINQPGFVALGALQVGDAAEMALELFGFPEMPPHVPLQWILKNGAQLEYNWYSDDDFTFTYQLNEQTATVYVEGVLLTNNLKDYPFLGVNVIGPETFLDWCEEKGL